MKKELVKVGIKVKVSDSVFARMGANMAINVFIVGECHNEYFFGLKAYGNDNNFMAHCADFEPYEEPNADNGTYSTSDPLEIAWLKRMCAENKEEREEAESNLREILNLPKEESTPYQVKGLEGNVIEEKVVEDKPELIKPTIQKLDDGGYMIDLDKLDKGTYTPNELLEIIYEALQVSENLPITQEFIESFGFVGRKRATSGVHYKKGETLSLHHSGDNDYTLFFFENGFQDIVFDRYKCTTQSELRLLLTKGRIDCSK